MQPSRRQLLRLAAGIPLAAAITPARAADPFPSRVVRVVVPFTPGGSADASARILAEKLQAIWGQPVIIENKPGAGTTIASAYVARAPADGYTIYLAFNMSYAATASLYKNLPYDPLKDLTPISMVGDAPFVVAVGPALPAATLKEFVDRVQPEAGRYTFASTGTGAGPHLATVMFLRRVGIEAVHVPYRGTGEVVTALVGGHVHFSFLDVSALGALRGGKLKPLAVTSAERWAQLPEVPTVAEAGYPGFEITSGSCILGPAGMPAELVSQINRSIADALRAPDVIKRFGDQGFTVKASTPDELAQKIRYDIERIAELVRLLGLSAG